MMTRESNELTGTACVRGLALLAVISLTACGGGNGGPGFTGNGSGGNGGGGTGSGWTPGVFAPPGTFEAQCADPRSGNDPDGVPWPDVQGTITDENNFLRSYSNDTYLWYDEITDRDPGLYGDPLAYFDLLKTNALTASGNPKDQFHFTYDTDEWIALSESGVSGGYGAQFVLLESSPPREVVVAFTNPDTPAADNNLARGTEILTIDGEDVVNGNDIDTLNAGLFPLAPGETHSFEVRDPDGTIRSFSMQSALITATPVLRTETIATATGNVGYILFNDHIAIAEEQLIAAIDQLAASEVADLVLDLRYNGGGFLAIASQLAYMIAGPARTAARTFEAQEFNDKYPNTNPVTGQALSPVPFYDRSVGLSVPAGSRDPLPSLDLQRVYVITGSGTCSASEAIMNGLRGIGVDVFQIGSTTCGKPYGFYPQDNCGTTYFTIQFRGTNDAGFGDYADGFIPTETAGPSESNLPGCAVGDDFSAALGDVNEARLAATLDYRATGVCPPSDAMSAAPALGRLRLGPDESIRLPREVWRENRLMDSL